MIRFETIGIGSPYLTRLIIGRFRFHVFHRGDLDDDPHTHPWDFWTFPLTSYVERIPDPLKPATMMERTVKAFRIHRRRASFAHLVVGPVRGRKIVTLVWTGRKARSWGFLVPARFTRRFVPWKAYHGMDRPVTLDEVVTLDHGRGPIVPQEGS